MFESRAILLLCPLLLACAVAAGQVPIVDGDGMTFDDLIREETFVTIVLKDPSARDVNVRITVVNEDSTGVHVDTMGVLRDNDKRGAYKLSRVQEVRVQDGRIPTHRTQRIRLALTEDELTVINDAAARALEIFGASKGNQAMRIQAALVLAVSPHESKPAALRYLQELAAGNDVPTAMEATVPLYLAGFPPDLEVIKAGFGSGNRRARGLAATLTGLTKDETFLRQVKEMLNDPLPELFVPAAIAIGRLNERSGLPKLYGALGALTEEKGEAAVLALSEMGGEDVHEKMLEMLDRAKEKTKVVEWFRVLRVLYALGDDRAKVLMKEEALGQQAYQRAAAILLAADGVWEGTVFLRDYRKKADDPNLVNLKFQATIAETLYTAGDIQEKNRLQRSVNTTLDMVYAKGRTGDSRFRAETALQVQLFVVTLVGGTGSRDMLSLLAGPVESVNAGVAIAACRSVMAIADPEFGARLNEMQL